MANAEIPLPSTEAARFTRLLETAVKTNTLHRLILSKYCGAEEALQRLTIRPVVVRDEPHLCFVYRYKTRDITKNYPPHEALTLMAELLGNSFRDAHLFTAAEEAQLSFSKKGKPLLHVKASGQPVANEQGHDREKRRFVDIGRPFLVELGITDRQHHLIPTMARKWKQINKFIEVFERAFDSSTLSQQKAVHVFDFGSGKGYLTFAIHDYLHNARHLNAEVTGVELRGELINLCTDAATRLGLEGLNFREGDVRHYTPAQLDVMIALHACDIATDYAIHMGIRSNASIIMCAPCCHKEIRPQMQKPAVLQPLLQYGVHLGQEAEMVTDALRALLLEAHGYDTQLFEFVSLEHTSKNKMILAVKRQQPRDPQPVLRQIADIKQFYGIKAQTLEKLLQGEVPTCNDDLCTPRDEE